MNFLEPKHKKHINDLIFSSKKFKKQKQKLVFSSVKASTSRVQSFGSFFCLTTKRLISYIILYFLLLLFYAVSIALPCALSSFIV